MVLIALAVACIVGASPAEAATKRCSPVTGHPGGRATWKIDQIRVTDGFSCKRARSNIRAWVGFGGMMDNPDALAGAEVGGCGPDPVVDLGQHAAHDLAGGGRR